MVNIDKVIEGMEHCIGESMITCDSCPYHRHKGDTETYDCQQMHREAIKLLQMLRKIMTDISQD